MTESGQRTLYLYEVESTKHMIFYWTEDMVYSLQMQKLLLKKGNNRLK